MPPHLPGRTTGDKKSPFASEKSVCSERKRSSQSFFSPADMPLARRFCLSCPFFGCKLYAILNEEEKRRGLCLESTGRWVWTPTRTFTFGPVSRPNGTRTSSDDRDLAAQRKPPKTPLRLCGSASLRCWVGAGDLRLSALSADLSGVRIWVHLCDLWAFWAGGRLFESSVSF